MKMKKDKPTQEYGKPYTPKDCRQVGIGLIIIGIIIAISGTSVYQNGLENQMVLTKVGNQMVGSDPNNVLYLMIGVFGGILSVTGVSLWIRGKIKQK
jgi:hypothetical protein